MPRLSDLSQAQIDILESAGKSVVEALRDIPFEAEGTPKATLKYPDGGYKVKPLPPGVSFFFADSYLGKKGEVIFVLSPEDAQDFEFTEFSFKGVDTVFPLAGPELANQLEMTGENFKIIFDELVTKIANEEADAASRAQAEYESDPNYGMF